MYAFINPPIILADSDEFAIALLNFETYNSIPNIDDTNNKFYLANDPQHAASEIPEGCYEIDDINEYLQNHLKHKGVSVSIRADNTTLKTRIKSSELVDFTPEDSIAKILGFENRRLTTLEATSDNPADIFKVNTISVVCNLVSGSYVSDSECEKAREGHIIHQLFPNVPPGFKIVENPTNLIYLPINSRIIDYIALHILDQDGNLVNFRGERVTVRLHLKKI